MVYLVRHFLSQVLLFYLSLVPIRRSGLPSDKERWKASVKGSSSGALLPVFCSSSQKFSPYPECLLTPSQTGETGVSPVNKEDGQDASRHRIIFFFGQNFRELLYQIRHSVTSYLLLCFQWVLIPISNTSLSHGKPFREGGPCWSSD